MKKLLLKILSVESHINCWIVVSTFFSRIPMLGKLLMLCMDRLLLILYGVDLTSNTIHVKHLSISHPSGVLLGGNGIFSDGRVVVMSGVKFGGKSPSSEEYQYKHALKRVFELGDNVVIGSNSVILGPVNICDNVIIGSMSLVNKSISEPGVYVGVPVKKISDEVSDEWVRHLSQG